MKKTVDYREKHHFLSVDGVDYEIPQRTPKIEEQLKDHDAKLDDMTEYEANMSLLNIFFGDKAAEMFQADKEINLDKLNMCVQYAKALYFADYYAQKDEEHKEEFKRAEPYLSKANDLIRLANEIK